MTRGKKTVSQEKDRDEIEEIERTTQGRFPPI